MSRPALLVIDAGSSSIRCIVYDAEDLKVLVSCSRKQEQIRPNDGRVLWQEGRILETMNSLVDEILLNETLSDYDIKCIGFSSFVMNLIGVDASGRAVDDDATVSYACNAEDVNAEVEALKV